MKVSIISFTESGIQLSVKIAEVMKKSGAPADFYPEAELYTKCTEYFKTVERQSISFVRSKVGDWAKEQIKKGNVMIFIGACGIAVRAIAPHITDKLHDRPVLVIDERGEYVIPILAGHVGGANELALWLADLIGGKAVITTATDINHRFAVDLFAKKNNLSIVNKDGIVKISAKVLAHKEITISVEQGHFETDQKLPAEMVMITYPPSQVVDILITSEKKEFDAALLLNPKEYVIGIGCKKNKDGRQIEDFIRKNLEAIGAAEIQVAALASIDQKAGEPGVLAWSRKNNIPFLTYTAEELRQVKGTFHASEFVESQVGVDNVCERAALKAAEPNGKLIYEKHAENGMTIAIAKREWSVKFDET